MTTEKYYAGCRECGWEGQWSDIHRVTEKKNKMTIYTLFCPECKNEGITYHKKELKDGQKIIQ